MDISAVDNRKYTSSTVGDPICRDEEADLESVCAQVTSTPFRILRWPAASSACSFKGRVNLTPGRRAEQSHVMSRCQVNFGSFRFCQLRLGSRE
jgi:hypothetical protein